MKKSELKNIIKEELKRVLKEANHFSTTIGGVEISFTGLDRADRNWGFAGKSIVKFVKDETEIGPLRVKKIHIDYY